MRSLYGPPELEQYRDAVRELLWVHPAMGQVARSMGEPVFTEKDSTAFLELDEQKQIRFNFNPNFILDTDVEKVSAVIAHETYHLILDHFREIADKNMFPETETLIMAQEIIVDDIIENIYHMKLPDFFYRGLEILGEDCSQYTSKQVYDKLIENGQGQGENDKNGEQGDQQGDGQGDGGQGQSGESDESKHGCGGVHGENGDQGGQGASEMQQAFEDLINDAADAEGKSAEDIKNDLQNDHSGGFSLGGPMGSEDATLSRERMNWKRLLAKINPKIMDSGRPRRRTHNNWMKPNRRMVSVYPKTILPVIEPIVNPNDEDGDTIPSFVIALDLSGSIPRSLVNTLQGLLEDIPEDLINAYPCTWSSELVPFDPETRKVAYEGGTVINKVVNYVKKIKEETGKDPYTLVITDGEFWGFTQPEGPDWYWMAVRKKDLSRCRRWAKTDDHVFCVDDFKV